jgi:mono/diheme cytochrome c family protein
VKKILILIIIAFGIWACGSKSNDSNGNTPPPKSMVAKPMADDGKGVGEFKDVKLNDPLNQEMIASGKAIYDMKCSACHKLTSTRVVGPGFKGVTERRKPEWIMNMVTNVEIMLDKDPAAQKLLEECLTRMPNQNVSAQDARDILEFFYNNDAK